METTVRAGGMQGYQRMMRALGHDPSPLLARCGLSAEMLADEDNRVSLQAAFDLLAVSAEHTGLQDIGLRAAQYQDISMLGPLALAMQNCPTIAESLKCLTRFLYVQSPALVMSTHLHSDVAPGVIDLRYEPSDGGRLRVAPQVFDHGIAIAHSTLRMLAAEHYALAAVSLPFAPKDGTRAHESYFGVPVRTGQAYCALHFAASMLAAPVHAAKATLLKIATDYLTQRFPQPDAAFAARVHLALRHCLGSRFADKSAVAATLAMHPRTLQRRLTQEGTSFESIRDDVRREAALRYLQDTQYPIAEIAGLVGFSEQSTFTRFCKQRIGATPSAIRERQTRSGNRLRRSE
jgi:AraC-like DNA-binding protein